MDVSRKAHLRAFVELDVRVGGAFRVDMHIDEADTIHTHPMVSIRDWVVLSR